jgi:hypothetical protein
MKLNMPKAGILLVAVVTTLMHSVATATLTIDGDNKPVETDAAATQTLYKADFYLSPNGSDAWSGTLSEPNSQETDGPFATLERARDAVRDLKKSKSADIIVLVREGTYQLDKTVVFGLQDSGVGDSTVTYEAYPNEKPVFSSGQEIKGWKQVTAKPPGLPDASRGQDRSRCCSSVRYVLCVQRF